MTIEVKIAVEVLLQVEVSVTVGLVCERSVPGLETRGLGLFTLSL